MHHSKHWLTHFGLEGVDDVAEALNSQVSNPIIRVSDLHFEHGRFSLLLLCRSISKFRSEHCTPLEVFRLDFPGHNYNEMLKILKEEAETYLQHSDVYTYFTNGPYMGRLHPNNSIHVFVASHIMTGINVRAPAPDTFYPSMSRLPEVKNIRKEQAISDLSSFLNHRIKELVVNGRIYFDVMGKLPEFNFSEYMDRILAIAIERGALPKEFKEFGFRVHLWEKEDVLKAVESFGECFEIVSYKEKIVNMPHYEEYLNDRDGEKYKGGLVLFWTKALEFSLKMHFKSMYRDEEYSEMVKRLQEFIMSDSEELPHFRANSHHLVLRKVKEFSD